MKILITFVSALFYMLMIFLMLWVTQHFIPEFETNYRVAMNWGFFGFLAGAMTVHLSKSD